MVQKIKAFGTLSRLDEDDVREKRNSARGMCCLRMPSTRAG